MNLASNQQAVVRQIFRLYLNLRGFLPGKTCKAFREQRSETSNEIGIVYVINLDREPKRMSRMQKELKRVIALSGNNLLSITERYSAVDARSFTQDPPKTDEIDPIYSLRDQLYVEPQPLALPTKMALDAPIKMSRAEIAVAQSHINVWKKIAAGDKSYALVLEDDVWLHPSFSKHMSKAWHELGNFGEKRFFDIFYISYQEVKNGASKISLSHSVFKPVRGLWHLSGYILSREGAKRLLQLLPCHGPVDLWINHQFANLEVRATKRSIINQRRDIVSSNSYSILPSLSGIGAINSEGASLFNIRPNERPIFAFGPHGSGQTSLAMALSMLGYRCCSDLQSLPYSEAIKLATGREDRIFDAYVNIGSLEENIKDLQNFFPRSKFIFTTINEFNKTENHVGNNKINGILLPKISNDKWSIICEYLRCPPPSCHFPILKDIGQRKYFNESDNNRYFSKYKKLKHDKSPWIIETQHNWLGIHCLPPDSKGLDVDQTVSFIDLLTSLNASRWYLRSDTFTDNLALFQPTNAQLNPSTGLVLSIRKEQIGVRNYTAAALCSKNKYLFGKFEIVFQASNVSGVVTGFFLHRNTPRQEIDIEIAGNQPDRLLVNVFYNPGGEGANFDYGYRGTPSCIDLGFDASKACHRYTIEWNATEIRWIVDGQLVHRRRMWNPTPIPDLPMTLHVNSWVTRSRELAGRVKNRQFPATTLIKEISVDTESVDSSQ